MHAHTHAHTHRSTCLVRLSVCPPSEARLPPWCQWEGRVRQSELRVRSCVSNPSLEWLTYSVTVCSLSKHLPSVLWSAVACLREREREKVKTRRSEDVWHFVLLCAVKRVKDNFIHMSRKGRRSHSCDVKCDWLSVFTDSWLIQWSGRGHTQDMIPADRSCAFHL